MQKAGPDMAEFLAQYSIQRWMEMCPQGYLEDTVYGHEADAHEPETLLADDDEREAAIRTTVGLVVGERCALAASSGLVNAAPDYPSKRFLATQTLDEARKRATVEQGSRKASLARISRNAKPCSTNTDASGTSMRRCNRLPAEPKPPNSTATGMITHGFWRATKATRMPA